jgi:hypothetical protein
MSKTIVPQISQVPIAKVVESILPKWRDVATKPGDEGALARDELIYSNTALLEAFYKSDYAKRHIDWDYAAELIYTVLQANDFKDAKGFANRLNAAVEATASQRHVVVIVPLGFSTSFDLFRQATPFKRSILLGEFKLSPAAATANALNKILASYGSAPVASDAFAHQVVQSHKALGTHPLLTFEEHGSLDALRIQPLPNVRRLVSLIELFARIFGADLKGPFDHAAMSRHIFIVNKQSGYLNRVPSLASLSLSFSLNPELIKALQRPEFNAFAALLGTAGKDGLVARLRNALGFFGRAINEPDRLTRFLFLVIAMEAIFSRDKHAPIKTTLADHATILCFKTPDRLQVHADLRKIYDERSSIVHNGVSYVDSALIAKAEKLAARSIYCSLALAVSVKDGTGSFENRFFDRLLELKVGTASNGLKLPQWTGYGQPDDDD